MPAECHEDAFKYGLWRLTDARYREAAEEFYERKSRELHYVDANRQLASRVRRKPSKELRAAHFEEIDIEHWRHVIRKAGAVVRKFPAIKTSWIDFTANHRQSMYVD